MFKGAIKLSELKNDEMLLVGESLVLSKEDYLKEMKEHEGKEVYLTFKYKANINARSMLDSAIECEADNMYEDWDNDIWDDIKETDITELQNILDKILSRSDNVSYQAYKRVEVDI